MPTLAERITEDAIRMQATHLGEKVDPDGWPHDLWRCTLRSYQWESSITIEFRQGIGHDGKRPDKKSVLECLLSDASSVENSDGFEGWCGEYGFETDSRKAEQMYVASLKQTQRLKKWLGTRYEAYLLNTETDQ